MMVLQAPFEQVQTTTYLPSPKFGDKISPVAELTRRVSMDNVVYTYVKKKGRRRLVYSMRLDRFKAAELQAFVAVYLTAEIRLTTHDDEVWRVKFVTNPFSYATGTRGESVNVDIQLEGTKIYGPESDC